MEDDVQLLRAIARRAARQLRAPVALIAWIHDGGVISWAFEGTRPSVGEALVTALAAQTPQIHRGIEADAMGAAASGLGLASFASARSTAEATTAFVFVADTRKRDFEPAALAALDELAREAASRMQDLRRT